MNEHDKLIGALIGLARALEMNEDLITGETNSIFVEGMRDDAGESIIDRIEAERRRIIPNCYECTSPCGHNEPFDMAELRLLSEEERSAKLDILAAAGDYAARNDSPNVILLRRALLYVGMEGLSVTALQSLAEELKNA